MHPEPVPTSATVFRLGEARSQAEGMFDQQFRLWSRNQDVRRQVKIQVEEFLMAQDVRQGLALLQAPDQGFEMGELLGIRGNVGVRQQPRARSVQRHVRASALHRAAGCHYKLRGAQRWMPATPAGVRS